MSEARVVGLRIRQLFVLFSLLLGTASGFAQVVAPSIVKSFSAASVALNNSVTLTFTITNPNATTDLTGVSFNDTFPSGLIIANPDSLTGTCDPGVITPSVTSINLVGGTVLAASSCTFSIDVLAISSGTQVNTTDQVTSNEGGTGNTATASVDVLVADLTITKTHTGNFTGPQTGATYTITVTNSGGGDTSALVTVNDNLPSGLTATAFDGGPNWSCTLSPLQCNRGDVLAAGASYDPIILTVNVAANAGASVTNTATVSGGGESTTSNDTATDVTQIDAALKLVGPSSSLQVTAGSTGSTTINVNYNGALGAVTFACSGLPVLATCSFNPSSVSAAGITPVTVSIATTARSATFPAPPSLTIPPALLALMGLTAFALSLAGLRKQKVRLAMGLAGAAFLLAGCGSSKGSSGTPAGTSAVVIKVTSASGGATATSTINLTVQ